MRDPRRVVVIAALVLSPLVAGTAPRGQAGGPPDTFHRPLDQILDVNVRDGLVYYRALRSDRGRLDRYVASLNAPAPNYDGWSREYKMAFWVNAYNAIVLQTVINHYPIHGASSRYPSNSIRQIPGAFDVAKYHLAGKNVTLDEIEKTVLPPFKEPRLFLALGRGALGSGRLRSEAYAGDRIEKQLDDVQQEFVGEAAMIKVDRGAGEIAVTPIVSWREAEFVQAYDKGSSGPYAQRSPIERAVIAFITPRLFPLEKEFVQKNEFRMTFQQFDWRLNDLTGGRPQ
jgi:uncharacterized protein DUF547